MNRAVVTGIGAVTPAGNSFALAWDALGAGLSGIGRITKFDPSPLPWQAAGEVKGFEAEKYLSRKEAARLDLFAQYAVAAALMAVEDSGLPVPFPSPSAAAVIIGSSRGGITGIEKTFLRGYQTLSTSGMLRTSPCLMPSTTVSMAASSAAQRLGITGHCLGISNACASGANALGEGFRMIRAGHVQYALVGGAEAPICRICVEGYGTAGALSRYPGTEEGGAPAAPRPFDLSRDGFVLAEGSCVLLLEEVGHAVKRRAKIYGEIVGYGNTTDSFHMTRPEAGGEAEAIKAALREAGVSPAEVGYVNTHGTATRIGDIAEAQALNKVFGEKASLIPATAVKSVTGHMLAASGPFEVASTLMSMKEGLIPPTINYHKKDPDCGINIVTAKRKADIRIALSNSFGFGGVNAVLVLKHY